MARILFLEPFYGGSHKNFADNVRKWSKHTIDIYSLPESNWKWRIRSSAYYFMEAVKHPEEYDLLVVSSMLQLADLKAYWGTRCPRSVVYFHETQLSYPLPPGVRADYQLFFTEFSNALHGDSLLFNSHFHRKSYLEALPGFLEKIPEHPPFWVIEGIRKKSSVMYPGVEDPVSPTGNTEEIPLILWNHRWDYDKQPEIFFRILRKLDGEKHPFRLVLLGENAQFIPKVFHYARERYGDRIIQFGWAESRQQYWDFLSRSRLCISTAAQENFGISMVEAACAGAIPLMPNRLSYPELIPGEMKNFLLYKDEKDLLKKVVEFLENPPPENAARMIRCHYLKHRWKHRIKDYDHFFDENIR